MSRKLRIYLDTSVISALFDGRNPDRKKITERFFQAVDEYEVVISDVTSSEVSRVSKPSRRKLMKDAISDFDILPSSDAVDSLAEAYVIHGAIPRDHFEDAQHIAFAVLNYAEYLLSWNFQHIVRNRTRVIVRWLNSERKLGQIDILTPGELL